MSASCKLNAGERALSDTLQMRRHVSVHKLTQGRKTQDYLPCEPARSAEAGSVDCEGRLGLRAGSDAGASGTGKASEEYTKACPNFIPSSNRAALRELPRARGACAFNAREERLARVVWLTCPNTPRLAVADEIGAASIGIRASQRWPVK